MFRGGVALMKRFNLIFSLCTLLVIGLGSYYVPENAFFWLASVDNGTQAVRAFLVVMVLAQLLTYPPRHLLLRLLTGITALTTVVWALRMSTFMNTPIFDTVVLLQTAIALGISALERPLEEPAFVRVPPLRPTHGRKV